MKKNKTLWTRVRDYFRFMSIGGIVSREDYIEDFYLQRETRLDEYRCILMKAGYLKSFKRGLYEKEEYIPDDLTYRQARREAYESNKQEDILF